MRKLLSIICFGFALFLAFEAHAQLVNCNPDLNREPSRELPDQYWTDLVTEQPEGYVVDANGDVHLHSAEALAWLISTVNGLNGQEADNFDGKKVTLEANVDMSEALWVPIADGTNLGNPNPDRLRFCGVFDGNGFVINGLILTRNPTWRYFEGFFGTLCGARIEEVVLRHIYAEGFCERDGKFFGNAESLETEKGTRHTTIDRCFVEIDEMHKDGLIMDGGLFGYRNDGIITNCMVKCGKLDYPGNDENEGLFVCHNYGTIENCASVADSLKWLHLFGGIANENHGTIENCYSFIGKWFGDYQTWWPPIPRLGVCVDNFGTIRNCYYNKFDSFGFSNEPVYTNQGVITNTESFFKMVDWVLDNPVEIHGENGIVYETDNLSEALNYWILGHGNEDVYMTWCEDGSFLEDNLPVLCDLDITDIGENEIANAILTVYPNPTNNTVSIDGCEVSEIQIYNTRGQKIKSVCNTNMISVRDLPSGVYPLRIMATDGSLFFTLVSVNQ